MGLFKKMIKQNKGLTLVELLCAIAIFSLVGTTVYSMMVISARNYQRDSVEIELQQEAQMTANTIQNLVMDANEVTYSCTIGGTEYMCLDEAEALSYGATVGSDRTLTIRKTDRLYLIHYMSSAKQILYTEYLISGGVSTLLAENQLMAENVVGLSADLKKFAEYGNLGLNMSMDKGERSYVSDYTITARNAVDVSTGDVNAAINTELELVLEPNQIHELTASVIGASDPGVSWSLTGNTSDDTIVYMDGGIWKLKIGREEMAPELTLRVATNVRRTDGITPQDAKNVRVYVRRVTGIVLNVNLISGTDKQAGAVYQVQAVIHGSRLDRAYGLSTDEDYINPNTIQWETLYSVNGVAPLNQADYYNAYDITDTSCKIRLNRNINYGENLLVTATSKHSEGIHGFNKTNLFYERVAAEKYFSNSLYYFDGGKLYRGTDNEQGNIDISILKTMVRNRTGIDTDRVGRYYRFRQIYDDGSYGPWVNWTKMTAEGGNSINLRPNETYRFESDKDYEVQIKFFMYKDNESNILWPFADTPPEDNVITAQIRRVRLQFNSSRLGISNAQTAGTKDSPVQVALNTNIDFFLCRQDAKDWGYDLGKNQNCINIKVEKLSGDSWVDADASDYTISLNDISHDQKVSIRRRGTYRIIMGLKNIPYRTYNYTTNTVTDSNRNYWISNEATGDGIYYIKAQ